MINIPFSCCLVLIFGPIFEAGNAFKYNVSWHMSSMVHAWFSCDQMMKERLHRRRRKGLPFLWIVLLTRHSQGSLRQRLQRWLRKRSMFCYVRTFGVKLSDDSNDMNHALAHLDFHAMPWMFSQRADRWLGGMVINYLYGFSHWWWLLEY